MSYTYKHPHPAVTTDIVVMTIRDNLLKVLLIKRKADPYRNSWALPGGFLRMEESLDACARRELREETGIDNVYLEQLYTFGQPERDPRERVVSTVYFALIPTDIITVKAATDASDAAWFAMDQLPELAFDHQEILEMAKERLVAKLGYSTIAFQLMAETFTLSELQRVYEIILDETLDKRNYRKRILSLDEIEDTGETRAEGAHRPAALYRLKNPTHVIWTK